MKKVISMVLTVAMVLTVLTACGQPGADNSQGGASPSAPTGSSEPPTPSGEEKVIVFNGPDEWVRSQLQADKGGYEEVVARFESENPGVKVKLTSEPWGTWQQKLPVVVAGGDAPDVFMLNGPDVATFYSGGYTADLSDMDQGFLDKFYPGVLAGCKDNDTLMALPFTTDCRVLWYNKEIFKAAGLDPERPPQTWDELVDYAKKCSQVTIDGQKVYGFGSDLGLKEVPSASLLCASDAMLFDAATRQPTVKTDTFRQYLQAMVDMRDTFEPDYTTLNHENVATLFGQKKVAIIIAGAWVWSLNEGLADEDWYGMGLVPKQNADAPEGSFAGGWAIGVSSKSKNLAEAKKFAQALYEEDLAYKLHTDVSPVYGADAKCAMFQNPNATVFVQQMSSGRQLMPPNTSYNEINSMFGEYASKAITGKITVDEALDGIDAGIRETLK